MNAALNERSQIYDVLANEYEGLVSNSPFYRDQRRCELELLQQYASRPLSTGRALDVGCGPGAGSRHLAARGFAVVAIDKSRRMRGAAGRALSNSGSEVQVLDLDAEDIGLLDGQFDVILSFGSVVNHARGESELDMFLQGVSRKLASNGVALIGTDNLVSIDSIGWLLGSMLSPKDLWTELTDIASRFISALRGNVYHNHWRLFSSRGFLELPLSYFPRSMLLAMFRSHRLEVIDVRGANIISSLSPTYLASSEFDANASRPSRLAAIGSWLDVRAGRLLNRVATYNVFVLRKL